MRDYRPETASAGKTGARSIRRRLFVDKGAVVQIDCWKLVLFGPVILVVLPFGLVAALRQQVHAAHHVAGVEIFRIDPRQQRHVVVFRPQRGRHLGGADRLHVLEQPAHEVGDQIDPQRPARPEISEHPDEIGHAGEHHAAIGHGVGEIQRLAVDLEFDVAIRVQIEAGRRNNDVGLQHLAGLQQNAGLGKAVDLVGHDRGLAGLDPLKQIAVRNKGNALPPWPVARREVGGDVVIGSEISLDRRQQILLGRLRLFEGLAGKGILIVQDLPARDFMDPGFVDLKRAQGLGDLDGIAAGPEIGRRALQHGDMGAFAGDRGDQRRRGGAGPDHNDLFVLVVEIVGPFLRMNDPALEGLHGVPFGRISLRVPIIPLAHPEEIRGEANRLAGVGSDGLDGPEIFPARPVGRGNGVPIADVRAQSVFLDDLAHVAENLRGGRDRSAGPGLEPIAEGMQVAVGADAGIAVGAPGSAKAVLRLEDDETCPRALRGQMIGGADPGDTGARDNDVEMLRAVSRRGANLLLNVHRTLSFFLN